MCFFRKGRFREAPRAYLRVDNIFNEQYEKVRLFGTPVRSIFGWLRVNYDAM